jgi:zinc transport system substrate-binding protein
VRSIVALLSLLAALACVAGCTPKPHARTKVAVSVFPVYDLVRRVAGDDADVALVVPQGTSPKGWTAPADVAARVAGANVVISVGLGLDAWMDALDASPPPKRRTLKIGDRVPTVARADGTIDPYVWMDPQRVRLALTAIGEELARADSSHAVAFRRRAAEVDAAVAALDKQIEDQVGAWPTRQLPALPDGSAYFADRYGVTVASTGGHAAPEAASRAPPPLDVFGSANTRTYEELIRAAARTLAPPAR